MNNNHNHHKTVELGGIHFFCNRNASPHLTMTLGWADDGSLRVPNTFSSKSQPLSNNYKDLNTSYYY